MTEYIRDTYHKENLPLETVDYAYVDGLNTYMQTAYNCHNNGAVNLLCCLKNFLLYAVRNEWIEKNPFRYYKMKIDKTNVKVPLTKAELDLLLKRPMPNERLARIRDVFCFCTLTGLAFTDVDHLRWEHFTTNEEGQLWIHKPREKTSVMSRVPVDEPCSGTSAGGGPAGEVPRRCQLSGAGQTAACPVEYEDERLPEGDSRYLSDSEASDHAPGAPYVCHPGD